MQRPKRSRPGRPDAMTLLRLVALAGLTSLCLACTAVPARAAPAAAESVTRTVVPLGRAVGIKLFSDGVMVVGLSSIPTNAGASSPAKSCGLKTGDIITHINSAEVDSIEEVQSVLQTLNGQPMSIRAVRGSKQVQMTTQAVKCSSDGAYKLGAWIRDSMAGIGTLTYYDPDSGAFAALGHGVSDVDTSLLMPLQSGAIMYADVSGVKPGAAGAPGELKGVFQPSRDLGILSANTQVGIFGTLADRSFLPAHDAVPVAARSQIRRGPATILSNIAGDAVEEYQVELTHLYPDGSGDGRSLMVKVTDPRLLAATGGIVQGMSGSPILQNGRLVGAVTHVLVNDPTQGYGVLAETMLDRASVGA